MHRGRRWLNILQVCKKSTGGLEFVIRLLLLFVIKPFSHLSYCSLVWFLNFNCFFYFHPPGRIKLSDCDSNKAVSNIKPNSKDLVFSLEDNGDIVADKIGGVYGVRVGTKVAGYIKGEGTKVKPVAFPKTGGKKKTCTLAQLMEANGIKKKDDTLVFDMPCVYCTHCVKLDTKEFGLPQTRNRGYMFVWQPEDGNINDDLVCHLLKGQFLQFFAAASFSTELCGLESHHVNFLLLYRFFSFSG